MARTEPLPPFSAPAPVSYDPYLDLGRLLARLDQNILRADGDRWRRLVGDEFQRLQARFDVAAARKLLTRVEQNALTIKIHARRQEVQAELNRRRALVEQLQERLDDLDEEARAAAAMEDEAEDDRDDGDGEDAGSNWVDDILAHVLQTPSESVNSSLADVAAGGTGDLGDTSSNAQPLDASDTNASIVPANGAAKSRAKRRKANRVRIAAADENRAAATSTKSSAASPTPGAATTATATAATTATASLPQATLRARSSRSGAKAGDDNAASTTSAEFSEKATAAQDLSSMRSSLLRSPSVRSAEDNAVANEEVLLDHHRREQEALSEDILRLAQALKEKSLATSRLLDEDKSVVDRVGEGLHTTNESLAAASRSMAVLSRMTEGKGWWGRMILYGMVYGLMALLVLLFLFLPKLRL